jgi:hypothetical protein
MAGKSDFTEQEWEQLRKGATGAGLLVAASDRSFFDSFKEATSLAKHLAGGRSHQSELVRELASEKGSGFAVRSSPEELEKGTVEALRGAVRTLEAKAPEEVEAYRRSCSGSPRPWAARPVAARPPRRPRSRRFAPRSPSGRSIR